MASKLCLLAFFLVLCCQVFRGFSSGLDSFLEENNSLEDGALPPCMQKLLPCQPYLKSPVSPPATCCLPLKQMVAGDPDCLCDVFDNPVLLKSLNITQEEALQLPKACGANVDLSLCKNAAAPPVNSAAPPPSLPTSSSMRLKCSLSLTTRVAVVGCGVVSFLLPPLNVLP